MSQKMRALRMVFQSAESVTCQKCGKELKEENLPRLARFGCPACGSKDFSFHGLPEEVANALQGAAHVR